MATNRSLIILFILSSIVTLSSFQCSKGGINCTENVYSFNLGVKAYPDKDSIRIGDTLWFEIDEPTTLKDFQNGQMIDYSGAENLGTAISFHKLSNSNQFTLGATHEFSYILINGTERNNADPIYLREFTFEERNSRYMLKLGIIPKVNGVFGLIFSNAANVYRKSSKCTKAGFGITFKNTSQHYYLNPNFQGGPTPNGGDYYFKVY